MSLSRHWATTWVNVLKCVLAPNPHESWDLWVTVASDTETCAPPDKLPMWRLGTNLDHRLQSLAQRLESHPPFLGSSLEQQNGKHCLFKEAFWGHYCHWSLDCETGQKKAIVELLQGSPSWKEEELFLFFLWPESMKTLAHSRELDLPTTSHFMTTKWPAFKKIRERAKSKETR